LSPSAWLSFPLTNNKQMDPGGVTEASAEGKAWCSLLASRVAAMSPKQCTRTSEKIKY
jgi:hypothetical protein